MSAIQKAREAEGFVGIDVSKETLDVCRDQQHYQILNEPAAIATFLATELEGRQIQLCVLESAGGYERKVLAALHQRGIPVHRAHPSRVHAFAKACNHFAKTVQTGCVVVAEVRSIYFSCRTRRSAG